MGNSNLASNKRKKKEKDICCFVIKRAKKTQKRKTIYIQILVQIHESYLHTYILQPIPICMSENQIMRRHNKCLS